VPVQETDYRNHKAVFWEADGYDTYGEPKVGTATEINVRWDESKSESLDALGNVIALDVTVVVAQDIAVGSLMWLGEKADLPSPVTNLYQVKTFSKVPDVKGRQYYCTVGLMRYSNEMAGSA